MVNRSTPPRRLRRSAGRTLALGMVIAVLVVVAGCGKNDSKSTQTATSDASADTGSGCSNGDFDTDANAPAKGLDLTATGNVPGWYVWFGGPVLHVRLVSDPANPLAPAPKVPPAPTAAYTGELRSTVDLGKATLVPDASAGVLQEAPSKVTFAINGQDKPVGFDVLMPCRVKKVQLQLDLPGSGGPTPASTEQIFVGRKSHPLNNPVVFERRPDPATTTTLPRVKPSTTATTVAH